MAGVQYGDSSSSEEVGLPIALTRSFEVAIVTVLLDSYRAGHNSDKRGLEVAVVPQTDGKE